MSITLAFAQLGKDHRIQEKHQTFGSRSVPASRSNAPSSLGIASK
jgi:hypothetical protein